MKRKFSFIAGIIGIVACICLVCYFVFRTPDYVEIVDEAAEEIPEATIRYGIPVDSLEMETYIIPKNAVLSQILNGLGASSSDLACVSTMKREDFDARSIRAGNQCRVFYSMDTVRRLCYFVYEKSPVDYSVFCFRDSFHVYHGQKEVIRELKSCEAEITSSLWNAAVDQGIDPALAMSLSDIYAWTIDFFGLQKGDHFKALYEDLFVDSVRIGIGRIYAAEFRHGGKEHHAFYFEQDSAGGYWDETGTSLRRAFLKAPLQFTRVSSHFSYARKHPVLRTVRPHTGVDYAAPKGTPVMTIGDGTVIEKGYKGGGGHTVKIRHNSTYTTAYLHLSGYGKDIKTGARVSQGQVIGFVGSTGLSTGPHLDFRVWKNGQPVNPLTVESPPVEPVSETNKPQYDSIISVYRGRLADMNRPVYEPDSLSSGPDRQTACKPETN